MTTTNIYQYSCKACNQTFITYTKSENRRCPACGTHQIAVSQGTFDEPDGIIPFSIDKDFAKTNIRKHLKKQLFLPSMFTAPQTIDTLQGIYLPFWLYDFKLKGTLSYEATKSFYSNDEKGRYQEVEHYEVVREGDMVFDPAIICASSIVDSSYIDECKPFNFKEAVSYDGSLFEQHMIVLYDNDFMTCKKGLEEQLEKQVMNELEQTVSGYQTRSTKSKLTELADLDVTYLLFPFWIMTATYKNKVYTCLINGQNGTITGRYPMDHKQYWKLFLLYFVIIFIVVLCVFYVF